MAGELLLLPQQHAAMDASATIVSEKESRVTRMFYRMRGPQPGLFESKLNEAIRQIQLKNAKVFYEITNEIIFQTTTAENASDMQVMCLKELIDGISARRMHWGKVIVIFALYDHALTHLPMAQSARARISRHIDKVCAPFVASKSWRWEEMLPPQCPFFAYKLWIVVLALLGALILIKHG